MTTLFAIAAVTIFAIGYTISLKIRPYTACRSCAGAGVRHGAVFGYALGTCHTCGGTGRKLRLGVRLLGGDR